MKLIAVEVKGISALLMHSFPMVPVEAVEKKPKEEQAEISAYRIPDDGGLYVPAQAFQRALVSAGTYSKGKGRGNLSRVIGGSVLVTPEYLDLGVRDYVIDSRPVVIPATKGRVMRYRPRLNEWKFTAQIEYDENLLTEAQLRRVVDDCGKMVGLLDFRPEKRGPFGRFIVTEWKNL